MKKLLILSVFLCLNACTVMKNEVPKLEKNTKWRIEKIENQQYPSAILAKTEFILQENGLAYAYMGCNRMTFKYTTHEDNRIHFGQAVMTRMACQNMKLENQFLVTLSLIDHYKIVADKLILTTQDQEKLILIREQVSN